jgi:hypothetical protein
MKRSEAQQLIEDYRARYFNELQGSTCTLSFNGHTITGVAIADVLLAKTTGMKNAPNKRQKEDKQYTPLLMEVITNQGKLLFAIEDTAIAAIYGGIRLRVGELDIDIRKV